MHIKHPRRPPPSTKFHGVGDVGIRVFVVDGRGLKMYDEMYCTNAPLFPARYGIPLCGLRGASRSTRHVITMSFERDDGDGEL